MLNFSSHICIYFFFLSLQDKTLKRIGPAAAALLFLLVDRFVFLSPSEQMELPFLAKILKQILERHRFHLVFYLRLCIFARPVISSSHLKD